MQPRFALRAARLFDDTGDGLPPRLPGAKVIVCPECGDAVQLFEDVWQSCSCPTQHLVSRPPG